MRPFCRFSPLCAVILMMASVSCLKVDDIPTVGSKRPGGANVGFDIKVTREGEEIGAERQGIMTKGDSPAYDSSDALATMDPSIPFGLVGIDYDHHALVVDNAFVNSDGSNYGAFLDSMFWDDIQPQTISFSA